MQSSLIKLRLTEAIGTLPRAGQPVSGLAVEGIGKRYGETVALSGVDEAFLPGSVHTVLGENGSGKSTLLKLLSGVVRPTEGRLLLNGDSIRPLSPLEMQAKGLATVFQEVLITPHRSVIENVLLGYDGLVMRAMPRNKRRPAVEAVLSALSNSPFDLDAPAGQLPLAAQQLVVIARSLIKLPSILLLDEATAALDFGDRNQVFEVIADYARADNIVIFISHRMDEVKRLSDRVTVLRSGRRIETLERAEVTSERLLQLMAPEARSHVA